MLNLRKFFIFITLLMFCDKSYSMTIFGEKQLRDTIIDLNTEMNKLEGFGSSIEGKPVFEKVKELFSKIHTDLKNNPSLNNSAPLRSFLSNTNPKFFDGNVESTAEIRNNFELAVNKILNKLNEEVKPKKDVPPPLPTTKVPPLPPKIPAPLTPLQIEFKGLMEHFAKLKELPGDEVSEVYFKELTGPLTKYGQARIEEKGIKTFRDMIVVLEEYLKSPKAAGDAETLRDTLDPLLVFAEMIGLIERIDESPKLELS